MNLKEKVKNLPKTPGVYLMKDSSGSIIYVGKSKSLKNRVSSYFQSTKSHSPKVIKLMQNMKDFDYVLLDTEFEAFMLECKLIKDLKPSYNRIMKSPLSYTYMRIKINENYPSIDFTNERVEDDGHLYFGPYTNKNTVERAIQGIKESCKLLCSSPSRSNSTCLNYSLGLCMGMCLGDSAKAQYLEAIERIKGLFAGSDKTVLEEMEKTMQTAAEKFDFETAAKYRDYITAINSLLNKEKVIEFAMENKIIAMFEYLGENIIKFFLINGNKVLLSNSYNINFLEISELKDTILNCLHDAGSNHSLEIGREEIDEVQIIYSYLKSSNCRYIIIPDHWLTSKNTPALDEALYKLLYSPN
jgi:excinuclease ABC subunit C